MIPRIEALNELTRLSQAAGMYDDPPKPRPVRYHLCNKMSYVDYNDVLQLVWRVVSEDGVVMTGWLSYKGAEIELGKLLAKQRKNNGTPDDKLL